MKKVLVLPISGKEFTSQLNIFTRLQRAASPDHQYDDYILVAASGGSVVAMILMLSNFDTGKIKENILKLNSEDLFGDGPSIVRAMIGNGACRKVTDKHILNKIDLPWEQWSSNDFYIGTYSKNKSGLRVFDRTVVDSVKKMINVIQGSSSIPVVSPPVVWKDENNYDLLSDGGVSAPSPINHISGVLDLFNTTDNLQIVYITTYCLKANNTLPGPKDVYNIINESAKNEITMLINMFRIRWKAKGQLRILYTPPNLADYPEAFVLCYTEEKSNINMFNFTGADVYDEVLARSLKITWHVYTE